MNLWKWKARTKNKKSTEVLFGAMDDILKRMEARSAKVQPEPPTVHPELIRVHEEEMKRRQELVAYRNRVNGHLNKLMNGTWG